MLITTWALKVFLNLQLGKNIMLASGVAEFIRLKGSVNEKNLNGCEASVCGPKAGV